MKLSAIAKNILEIPKASDCDITGMTLDSRKVKPGDLFFACQGTNQNGNDFIPDAIKKGAAAIIVESENLSNQYPIPIISLPNLNFQISKLAANFFNHPAKNLKIIGITGTNGKTSCSHFIGSSLQKLNIPCGIIGTLGNGLYGQIQEANLTTPDAITVQATLADFVKQKAKVVAMEVSSHGLEQGRVRDIPFEVGIFTNLSRDHLDYHGTMEAYGKAKRRLFDNPLLQHAVLNAEDAFGEKLIAEFAKIKKTFAYGLSKPNLKHIPMIYAEDVQSNLKGLSAKIVSPWGKGELQTAIIGKFNLSNVLATLTTLCVLDVTFKDALAALSELHAVDGRMQMFGGGEKPLVVVDYSHKPDALEKALIALRDHCQKDLYCVFGCGGNRDKGKRPMMAKIAEQYADHVIVTDDNPRHESNADIVADIFKGFKNPAKVILQHDRSKAIQEAIQCAQPGDCILIAGKGGERYQQIGNEKVPFCDAKEVTKYL